MVVEVIIEGCDDATEFRIDVSEREYRFLEQLSEIANDASEYCCQPRLYVKVVE